MNELLNIVSDKLFLKACTKPPQIFIFLQKLQTVLSFQATGKESPDSIGQRTT